MVVFIAASTLHEVIIALFLCILCTTVTWGLSSDGAVLLSFKYSILSDPLLVLQSWNFNDESACSWNGVECGSLGGQSYGRVIGLSLPSSQLLGSISPDLADLPHLQVLNLANNFINGSLPSVFFNSTELRFVDLSNNMMSGEFYKFSSLPCLPSLQFLNLSNNAFSGRLPGNLSVVFPNLTVLSVANNYLYGDIPSVSNKMKFMDLSYNLFNGSLPSDFGGAALSQLNISNNKLFGVIPSRFGKDILSNATIDLSFNNLTGSIPETAAMLNQNSSSFYGNSGLCGNRTNTLCSSPSSASNSPDESLSPTSSPALAAIPRVIGLSPPTSTPSTTGSKASKFRPGTVIGIIAGDLAGVMILTLVFYYVYRKKKTKKKATEAMAPSKKNGRSSVAKEDPELSLRPKENAEFTTCRCIRTRRRDNDDESEQTDSSENNDMDCHTNNHPGCSGRNNGTLVMLDGLKELELETLLKAPAFILGTTSSSITYKAVLEDGRSLAVRRIGESHIERFRDFENQVRIISKLVHPNLVRIRGFYWAVDEKLIIYDFVPNGSLAKARCTGSSLTCPLPWDARIGIAKGVARGLAFLHEKKHVHAHLKPSNVLLGPNMEPIISDFGLERIDMGEISCKGGSARNFGSKRSTASRDGLQDLPCGLSSSLSPSPSSMSGLSPYQAPESLRTLKPHAKWDVFSFGVMLLELLTGKILVIDEMGHASNSLTVEDESRAVRMADVAIRGELEGKEDYLLACFKLGYNCASPLPQKRPTMKEALLVLERVPNRK